MSSVSPTEFRVPPVDRVALDTRAAELATRSIKKEAKRDGLRMAAAMTDLTTLEGMDSPGKVRALCQKAMHPLAGSSQLAHALDQSEPALSISAPGMKARDEARSMRAP